jgi:hypothetical protein
VLDLGEFTQDLGGGDGVARIFLGHNEFPFCDRSLGLRRTRG